MVDPTYEKLASFFRVWDLEDKKMRRVMAIEFTDEIEGRPGVQVFCGNGRESKWLDVGKFILMRGVGLPDKSGKMIYEGDIEKSGFVVSYLANTGEGLGMNAGWYLQRDNFESWIELECREDIEIIGNIYENPNWALNNQFISGGK